LETRKSKRVIEQPEILPTIIIRPKEIHIVAVRHIVMFRFKPETTEAEREAFLTMLRELPSRISEIIDFEAGRDILRLPRSFDMALVASYADLAALDRYAKHEAHLPVIERSRQICEQVASVDYEY
jgi:hypothetical protein